MSAPAQAATPRPPRPQGGLFGRGPMGGIGMPAEKAMTFKPSAQRLMRRLAPQRAKVAAVLVLAVLSVGFAVAGPKLLGRATDIIFAGVLGRQLPAGITAEQAADAARAAGHANTAELLLGSGVVPGQGIDFGALAGVLLWAVALFLASSVFSWLQGYLLNDVVQATVLRLRSDVEDKLHRLPLRYFDRMPRGELLSRVTNDIDNVSQTLQQTMSQLLTSLLTVLGVLVVMVVISPLLAVIALVSIPLSVLVTTRIAKRSQKQFVAQWANTGTLNAHIEEAFTGHELVTVFGRRREVHEQFRQKNEALFQASFGAQFVSGLIMPAMMFIGNLNYVVIAVVGGLRVATGSLSLGDVQAFIQYCYEEDQPLIDDLSLVAEPGHTVAIVGPTGAGKTTLVNLVMRFYELDGGRITLDGVDITDMRREDLRSQIGMVLQDTWLFGGTIRDNIAYGSPSATEAQIHAAAEATFVDRFVRSLPDGYDTVINEEASNVSVGEKQLITIARAFLAEPALLILDEATSSVDTRTELLVQRAMAALRADRTSFVIAHRLSTIRDADLILVMEAGRIVESGTHDELLAARGAYHRLYNTQFRGPVLDPEELEPV